MTEYAQIADARLRKLGEAEWEIKSCMQRIEEGSVEALLGEK
nr:MAG TPA: hypothetical protein [Caudoviricetes sp.]